MSCIVPETEDEVYHIVSMNWFSKWQAYTYCENMDYNATPYGQHEPDNGESPGAKYPGPINPKPDLQPLLDLKFSE